MPQDLKQRTADPEQKEDAQGQQFASNPPGTPGTPSRRKKRKLRGIIFDFRNVIAILDNNLIMDRLATVCSLTPEELGGQFQQEASLFSDFECGAVSPEQFLEEVSRLCGRPLSEQEVLPIFTDIFTPIPSTQELIRKLKPRYRMGLIVNTNPWQFTQGIQTLEVFPLFEAVAMSFEVKSLKPDPRIFQDCLDKLDLVAEECVFITDTPAFAQAANASLLHGIAYRGHQELVRDLKKFNISF